MLLKYNQEDSSEDEEELLRVKEMNQFEGLCDGVLTSLGLVSSAVTEVRLHACLRYVITLKILKLFDIFLLINFNFIINHYALKTLVVLYVLTYLMYNSHMLQL